MLWVVHLSLTQDSFIEPDDLFVKDYLGWRQDAGRHFDGFHLDLEVPLVVDAGLGEESAHHFQDARALFVGGAPSLSQSVPVLAGVSYALRHAVSQAELGRQVHLRICRHADEHGLVGRGDLLLVSLQEVVFNCGLNSIFGDKGIGGIDVESHVGYEILSLLAPVGDNAPPLELFAA